MRIDGPYYIVQNIPGMDEPVPVRGKNFAPSQLTQAVLELVRINRDESVGELFLLKDNHGQLYRLNDSFHLIPYPQPEPVRVWYAVRNLHFNTAAHVYAVSAVSAFDALTQARWQVDGRDFCQISILEGTLPPYLVQAMQQTLRPPKR
jgi:hypothetical protein